MMTSDDDIKSIAQEHADMREAGYWPLTKDSAWTCANNYMALNKLVIPLVQESTHHRGDTHLKTLFIPTWVLQLVWQHKMQKNLDDYQVYRTQREPTLVTVFAKEEFVNKGAACAAEISDTADNERRKKALSALFALRVNGALDKVMGETTRNMRAATRNLVGL